MVNLPMSKCNTLCCKTTANNQKPIVIPEMGSSFPVAEALEATTNRHSREGIVIPAQAGTKIPY